MSTAEKIAAEIDALKPEDQSEVLDFVNFIKNRKRIKDDRELKEFSFEIASSRCPADAGHLAPANCAWGMCKSVTEETCWRPRMGIPLLFSWIRN